MFSCYYLIWSADGAPPPYKNIIIWPGIYFFIWQLLLIVNWTTCTSIQVWLYMDTYINRERDPVVCLSVHSAADIFRIFASSDNGEYSRHTTTWLLDQGKRHFAPSHRKWSLILVQLKPELNLLWFLQVRIYRFNSSNVRFIRVPELLINKTLKETK